MKETWKQAIANEMGCLSEKIPAKVKGLKVLKWILKKEIPTHKKITYKNMVCDYQPLKSEKYCVLLTIRRRQTWYKNETTSLTSTLLKTKSLLNSTVSNAKQGAQIMTMDITDFFLLTPLL